MGHQFGRSSLIHLATCHEDMQAVMNLAIRRSRIDFGIAFGYRSLELQFELFKKGRKQDESGKWVVANRNEVVTNCDGFLVKSNHNQDPSPAADIYIYVPGEKQLTWDNEHLTYVAGVIQTCADELLEVGEISHKVVWGANWDDDGQIIYDHNLHDRPHFELQKP
ncbi:MAG: hypothetical protein RIE86_09155 [Imperialibacter sp.]|uniref:hypothetical protein n=1 Tax=Imperialibacter sp. TaxID=2038411 RepID=UPI0032EEB32C